MGNAKERIGAAGVAVAKAIFRLVLFVCIVFLIFWAGKSSYDFAYAVFNEQPMSRGDGQVMTIVIEDGSNILQIGKTLEEHGLIQNAYAFMAKERISNYHGQLKAGTYELSTAFTPTEIMGILTGEQAGENQGDIEA